MSIMIGNRLVHVTGTQVQSDWDEEDQTRPSYIKNKPTVATIGQDGKVLPEQLPELDYVPNDEKGAANGVATLDANGQIPPEQIPDDAVQDWWWLLDGAQGGDVPVDYPIDLDEDVARWLYARLNEKIDVSSMGVANGIATLGQDGKITPSQLPALDYIPNSEKGVSVATLGNNGKVPSSQLPSLDYVPNSEKGVSVATLGSNGKVPASQLPSLDYIPNSEKGTTVATLGNDGKVPSSQLPALDYVPLTRTVNGKALSADISLTPSDVGSLPVDSTPVSLGVSMDPSTYVLTLQLKNSSNTVLDTKTVDLPLETMVVSASYSNGDLTLTLQSGQTVTVDISSIVSGLVNDTALGVANGVATLDNTGKVPSEQLPEMDYIPNDEKGATNGVATLDADGKVPETQLGTVAHPVTSFPDTSTVGRVGELRAYTLGNFCIMFACTSASNGTYTWRQVCPNLGTDGSITWSGGNNNRLYVDTATEAQIDSRPNVNFKVLTVPRLEYAVRSVLPNITVIPADTTEYPLKDASATTNSHSWTYVHSPSAATTYVFPAVTTTNVVHAITLIIDFSTVQTYAFEDSEGTALLPLFTPSISQGDVYAFKCEYSVVQSKWLIYPVKEGGVGDDYVMQSQVGAANGVAGLNSLGVVPEAQLPKASKSNNTLGIVKPSLGLTTDGNGGIYVDGASTQLIDNRNGSSNYRYIPLGIQQLNYAVRAALTDANHLTMVATQQATAKSVLGVVEPIVAAGAPTTSTVGVPGQLYVDTTTSKTYHCTAVNVDDTDPENVVTTYTWKDDINAKGGALDGQAQLKLTGNASGLYIDYGRLVVGNSASAGYYSCIALGTGAYAGDGKLFGTSIAIGNYVRSDRDGVIATGTYNRTTAGIVMAVGAGSASNAKKDIVLINKNAVQVNGAIRQSIEIIPSATSAYTLEEQMYTHTPDSASTYTLPAVISAFWRTNDNKLYSRDTTKDGVGYYGWRSNDTVAYTTTTDIQEGTLVYGTTALTNGVAIEQINRTTHDIILLVSFANTQSIAFEDSQGNTIVPLDTLDIVQGDVVEYICSWDWLQDTWVISASHRKPKPAPPLPVYTDGDALEY